MKTVILACLLAYFAEAGAQTQYTPLQKAGKETESILLTGQREVSRFMNKVYKYGFCDALKIDARGMSRSQLSEALRLVATQRNIWDLHLRYSHQDSLDIAALTSIRQLQTLYLESDSRVYPGLDWLNQLKRLNKVGIYIDKLADLPLMLVKLTSVSVIDLMAPKHNPALSSDLVFYYRQNDSTSVYLEINSEIDNVDLYADSIKRYILSLWPGAKEKKQETLGMLKTSVPVRKASPPGYPYYKPVTTLTPLDKNVIAEFETALIDPASDNTIVMKDGTILDIPAGAFISSSGIPVTGDVSILYRSVRTPAEMLSSGLTMFYDTAGEKEMFKSNGMFEIRAYSGQEQLQISNDRTLSMFFISNSDKSNYNLYNLNEQTGKWNYVNTLPQQVFPQSNYRLAIMKDKTEFADRYNDLDYTYLLPKGVKEGDADVPEIRSVRRVMNAKFVLYSKKTKNPHISSRRSLVKIRVDYNNCDKEHMKVRFFLLTHSSYKDLTTTERFFPELIPFANYSFEYDGQMNIKDFIREFKRNKVYSDIRIYYDNGARNAIIELKTATGFMQIPVKTCRTNRLGIEVAYKSFATRYRKYSKMLQIRERLFNKAVQKARLWWNTDYDTAFYYVSKPKDRKGKNVASIAYGQPNGTVGQEGYQLNIKVLGFFNCDQLYRLNKPTNLIATTFTCNSAQLDNLTYTYIVDGKAKGTYTYTPDLIVLDIETTDGLILTNSRGEIFTCTGTSLREQMSYDSEIKGQVIRVEKIQLSKSPEDVVQKLGS